MAARNSDIAEVLESIANLLEIEDASPFRIRAYRNASDTIRMLDPPLAQMVAAGEDLARLPDIGPAIARKITEIVETGHVAYLEKLTKESSPGLLELLRIPGLGPKRVRALRDGLGIGSLADLERAAEEGRLGEVPGFGAKTQDRLLQRLRKMRGGE